MIPPIKIVDTLGANATNTVFGIKIKAKVHPFGAILCQEHYEWWFKIWFFLAGVLPLLLFKLVPPLNRWLEFRGHAIECAVAYTKYNFNREEYIMKEANDMWNGYDGTFSSYTVEEVAQKLEQLQPWALKWCSKRTELIERYIQMDPKITSPDK